MKLKKIKESTSSSSRLGKTRVVAKKRAEILNDMINEIAESTFAQYSLSDMSDSEENYRFEYNKSVIELFNSIESKLSEFMNNV